MSPPAKRNDPARKAARKKFLQDGVDVVKEAERRAAEAERKAAEERKGGKK